MVIFHLLVRIEKPRRRVLMGLKGKLNDDVVGEIDPELLLEVLVMLPCDSDRCLVSARTSSRLTLSREYGVVLVSRISTNLEPGIVAELLRWRTGVVACSIVRR